MQAIQHKLPSTGSGSGDDGKGTIGSNRLSQGYDIIIIDIGI